jgi:hypothetical protein
MKSVYNYFIKNKSEMYRLIEERNGNYKSFNINENLDSVRKKLINKTNRISIIKSTEMCFFHIIF